MGSYAFSNQKSTYQNQWCRSFLFCSSATNRLITSKDHASVQINVGHSDENGLYTGQFSTFALCGFVRAQVCLFFPILQ
ncbi:putative ribosomal protein S21e [Helianthus annuus]|uniref:Ribosomal protein S21e n=1 Tax=Helianthus annuus TaxID=4232 RepID=A0A251VH71_HELAN|nr:putative ribosomal protein S21e [Helianthus annuus]KAJ0604402.1 putative ribosomal protein S21e [Helianthus annuus]KAJ0618435.1 putative ribosomal protein S21e [Helianthus annuus]KAJ0776885.1 putative ribosomal protein S21e [Helianthus annuus]KAJ0939499.1 putative ribosomal protein S21e [Helianthus annuus]